MAVWHDIEKELGFRVRRHVEPFTVTIPGRYRHVIERYHQAIIKDIPTDVNHKRWHGKAYIQSMMFHAPIDGTNNVTVMIRPTGKRKRK